MRSHHPHIQHWISLQKKIPFLLDCELTSCPSLQVVHPILFVTTGWRRSLNAPYVTWGSCFALSLLFTWTWPRVSFKKVLGGLISSASTTGGRNTSKTPITLLVFLTLFSAVRVPTKSDSKPPSGYEPRQLDPHIQFLDTSNSGVRKLRRGVTLELRSLTYRHAHHFSHTSWHYSATVVRECDNGSPSSR